MKLITIFLLISILFTKWNWAISLAEIFADNFITNLLVRQVAFPGAASKYDLENLCLIHKLV